MGVPFIPWQIYTMNSVKEAALDVKARIAIPMHYGLYEGTLEDAKTFKNLLEGKINVIILKKE
jgi:L-ascorbate metabolism protein UlaG (beta-lactamase superfamily)